ncbi:MAG: metal-dependent transcriptional regulator [Gemmatimonadota bacterium]|jgi:DtxR family Mn-dependent transcriptional regulator
MADETSGLSRSVEDYLKAIYSIGDSGEAASTSAIAEALEVQPASVTGMVKRLAESGYLEHVPYRGVRLTEQGVREALRVLRRHRILESYLAAHLDYPWEDVHEEAERLEHAASDELIERMAAALGEPSYDPHGAPIPTASGEVEATESFTLADLQVGEAALVRAVRDDDSQGLQAVEAAGLLPGTRLLVRSRLREPAALRLEIDEAKPRTLDLPLPLARRVYVVPVAPEKSLQETE